MTLTVPSGASGWSSILEAKVLRARIARHGASRSLTSLGHGRCHRLQVQTIHCGSLVNIDRRSGPNLGSHYREFSALPIALLCHRLLYTIRHSMRRSRYTVIHGYTFAT